MDMAGMRAANQNDAGAAGDQFLFEDRQSKEESDSVFTSDLMPKTDKDQKSAVGGLLSVLAYLALDLVWDSWEKTPGWQDFGSSLDGYVPQISVSVPIALLAAFITLLVLSGRRARGMALASLWVHDRTFVLVPSNKKKVSFDVAAARIGTVTVRKKAFAGGKSGMVLEDAAGNRHMIDQLSETGELGPFAEYCRRIGIRFVSERESRALHILIGAVFAAIILLFICALDSAHPVQVFVKMLCAALVGFWVSWILGEHKK